MSSSSSSSHLSIGGGGGGGALVPASAALSSSALAALEAAARAHLSALSQEREHHSLCALLFLLRAQRAAARTARALQHMQGELSEAERALIDAETHCSALQECTYKIEETRRFLVNRVKCAQWEKKSHFHLTAIDHMLGNVQPALFDVATMLRGHLRICAVARASMLEQHRFAQAIQTHQVVKERSFHSIKTILELLATAKARHLELRHLAAEVVERVGDDLERFLERKRRGLRRGGSIAGGRGSLTATPASALTSPQGSSAAASAAGANTLSSPGTEQRFSAVAAALASAATASAPNATGGGGGGGSGGSLQPLSSPPASLSLPLPPPPSVPVSALFHDPDALDAELAAHGVSTAMPSSSGTDGAATGELELALGLGLGAPFTAEQEQQAQTPRPVTPAADEPLPTSLSTGVTPSSSPRSFSSPSSSPPSSLSQGGLLGSSSSPPGAAAWTHLLGSAPPAGSTSVLMATVAAEDVWPASLDVIAAEHVDHLAHPVVHGHSSHVPASHTHMTDTLAVPVSPQHGGQGGRPRRKSASAIPSSSLLAVEPLAPVGGAATVTDSELAAAAAAATVSGVSPPSSPTGVSPPSSPSASARQGYIAIKMRYYAQLGHNQSKAVGVVGSPPLSPVGRHGRSASAAAALALLHPSDHPADAAGAGGTPARRRSEGHRVPETPSPQHWGMSASAPVSPSSPLGFSSNVNDSAAAAASSSALSPSPSGSSSSLAQSPSQPSPLVAVASQAARPRAILARSAESEGTSSPNKRWMLRPLPANTSVTASAATAASSTPVSPALPESASSPSLSPSPSGTDAGGGVGASSSSSPSPPAKRPWWKAIFSPRSSRSNSTSGAGSGSAGPVEESSRADKKNGKRGLAAEGPVLSPPSAAPSTSSIVAAAASDSLPPLPPNETRLLAADWAALHTLLDSIESANSRQQRAWEVLESVLDKRERAQAEERRAAKIAAEAAAAAAKAAAEAAAVERAKLEEAAAAAAASRATTSASSTTGPRPIPSPITAPREAATARSLSPKSPLAGGLVHSSHSVSSSSPLLASSSSGSSGMALSPPGPESPGAGAGAAGTTRAHRKSVLSALQGVPAPTLMPAFAMEHAPPSAQFDPSNSQGAELAYDASDAHAAAAWAAAAAAGLLDGSYLRSQPLSVPARPSSVSLRTSHMQSRSVPSTPAERLRSVRGKASTMGAEVSDVSGTGDAASASSSSGGGVHARRASDSAAPGVGSGTPKVKSPRSAPATVRVRSSSFSFALALHRAVQAHAAAASGSGNGGDAAQGLHPEFDADFAAMLSAAADRSRHSYLQHHSPPSPGSLVF